jgi:hypothetical protein
VSGSWSNPTVTRVIIDENGDFTGLFFYSPTPGHGNLVGAWTASAGTDPYGNPYFAGFAVYNNVAGNQAGSVLIASSNDLATSPVIIMQGSPGFSAKPAAIGVDYVTTGASNVPYENLVILGPAAQPATDPRSSFAFIEMLSGGTLENGAGGALGFGNDLGVVDFLVWTINGCELFGTVTALQPDGAGTEVWHPLAGSYANGWTDFGGGEQVGRYKIDSTNRVWLDGDLKPGSYASGDTIFTLPVGYRPVAERVYEKQPVSGTGAGCYTINILPSGIVQVNNVVGAAPLITGLSGISFPVD